MQNLQKYPSIYHICRVLFTAGFLFIAGSGNVLAYGGYHHYGHHGHYGVSAHYSSHGDIGTAGYVILGLFGAVLLSHLLSSDYDRPRGVYHRSYAQTAPVYHKPALPVRQPAYRQPVYSFSSNEGWDALINGNARLALDIFAVQSQQDLDSGIPKAGFALAAAANGELDRGVIAMRKAISLDPDALNVMPVYQELGLTIDLLIEDYHSALTEMDKYADHSFMIAALSYLNHDYVTASDMIAASDHSQSSNNLRILIDKAIK